MLIRNSKAFVRGLLLLASFTVVFCVFFMQVFPGPGTTKITGLVYADNLFNTLSKGSSNFFDSTATDTNSIDYRIKGIQGKQLDLAISFKENDVKNGMLARIAELTPKAGLETRIDDNILILKGDLHTFLTAISTDSLDAYHNEGGKIAERYGLSGEVEGKRTMKAWWTLLNSMIKPLQVKHQNEEASAVSMLMTKGVECSYNFYGIESLRVADNIPLVAGFLIFYVVYTMWYGFAIFELFDGIGLTMSKSASRQET